MRYLVAKAQRLIYTRCDDEPILSILENVYLLTVTVPTALKIWFFATILISVSV